MAVIWKWAESAQIWNFLYEKSVYTVSRHFSNATDTRATNNYMYSSIGSSVSSKFYFYTCIIYGELYIVNTC